MKISNIKYQISKLQINPSTPRAKGPGLLRIDTERIKIKNNLTICNFWLFILLFTFCILNFSYAQPTDDIEFNLDINSATIPLPKIFKPNIDLSGRGFHRELTWPQEIAAREVLEIWQKDIGFSGLYRMQYDLWEIHQLSKNKELQDKLLANYESIIKKISDKGGTVILDIFGTPAGLGKVLDKKSAPWDQKAFKELVRSVILELSCKKKYNIWYEVWNAPDLDDFFLGRRQEYLILYRAVAESVKGLEQEYRMHIPIGAPSTSWWFQDVDGNTVVTPERSLVYELIKYCYSTHLPLDFISWHGFSSDPKAEKESTIYNKKDAVTLIRDWLSYFSFDRNTPLVVDEWNYDRSANVLPERKEKSFISASFVPARIRNMYEAGIDHQIYFCLEDFKNNKEGVVRNVGIFSFDPERSEYKGEPKSIYNVFKMLNLLGNNMFTAKLNDEFISLTATKLAAKTDDGQIAIIISNYIDPDIVTNYLSRNIAILNGAERKALLSVINSGQLEKILLRQLNIASLRLTNKTAGLLKKAQELNDAAKKFLSLPRSLKINLKNLKDDYSCEHYLVDYTCSSNCKFEPAEEKETGGKDTFQETVDLKPYSVHMLVFKKKPKIPAENPPSPVKENSGPLPEEKK